MNGGSKVQQMANKVMEGCMVANTAIMHTIVMGTVYQHLGSHADSQY